MAGPAAKAAAITTLRIGSVEAAVALYQAHADPKKKLAEFDRAGPHGGVLKVEQRARAVPAEETVDDPAVPVGSDPLGEDPGSDAPPVWIGVSESTAAPVASDLAQVAGEYASVLVEEGSGQVVQPDQVRRGVRLDDGRFVDCTDELAKIEESTKLERIEIVRFLNSPRVQRSHVKGCYYIGAADERAPKPLRLVYEALKWTQRVGEVKLTKRSRQSHGVIAALGKCLVLYELVWAEDFREPPARALAIQQAEVSQGEVSMACELVHAMAAGAEDVELRDDAIALREGLRARALSGEIAAVVDAEVLDDAQELADQLAASLAAVS